MTLAIAMFLDALLGEPKWIWSRIPHPAVLMGRVIDWADYKFNITPGPLIRGVGVIAVLSLAAAISGIILAAIPGQILDIILLAILVAHRSLVDHVRAVVRALRISLPAGQQAVAQIVGRETQDMQEPDVARAAIESAAENLSDGVIAPIFWFLIAGLPGLLIYKIVNTADSMVGHLTTRHADFGWAAAKLDDALNFVPARLTAFLILAVTWRFDAVAHVRTEAPQHRSPNAGWPEAAMAYALNVALSGPRRYDGKLHDEPFVNREGARNISHQEVSRAVGILWRVWFLAFIPALLIGLFLTF